MIYDARRRIKEDDARTLAVVSRGIIADLCDALEAESEARESAERHEGLWRDTVEKQGGVIGEIEEENRMMREALEHIEEQTRKPCDIPSLVMSLNSVARHALREGGDGDR